MSAIASYNSKSYRFLAFILSELDIVNGSPDGKTDANCEASSGNNSQKNAHFEVSPIANKGRERVAARSKLGPPCSARSRSCRLEQSRNHVQMKTQSQ